MANFEQYAKQYENVRMERRDGILQITLHSNGDTLQWGAAPTGSCPMSLPISEATRRIKW
jgi:hypothetical protein